VSDTSSERPVPLSEFARIVGPRTETTQVLRNGQMVPQTRLVQPGSEDEVWLRLLRMRHPNERHTMTQWRALITRYKDEPAHPSHPKWKG
jgi:hypothetical protein